MSTGSRRTLMAVGACALAVAGALSWATVHALRLERREIEAQARAEFQSSIRLALWRMDSALTPIVAREAARPYFHYSAFYPAQGAYTSALEEIPPGEALTPSPLLTLDPQFVLLHFQRSGSGELTSPQAPAGNLRDLAELRHVGSERVIAAEARLAVLSRLLEHGNGALVRGAVGDQKQSAAIEKVAPGAETGLAAAETEPRYRAVEGQEQIPLGQGVEQSQREFAKRQQNAQQALRNEQQANRPVAIAPPSSPGSVQATPRPAAGRSSEPVVRKPEAIKPAGGEAGGAPLDPASTAPAADDGRAREDTETKAAGAPELKDKNELKSDLKENRRNATVRTGADLDAKDRAEADEAYKKGAVEEPARIEQGDMAPIWRTLGADGPQLLLVRTVRVGDTRVEQGCWLDWPSLRAWLEGSVQDLVPGAVLAPVVDPYAQADPEALGRRLAGISAELEPGPMPAVASARWTPMRTTLAMTWGAVVLSLGAIGAALLAARDLAERRGQFVSAVTHELRTPLTTFCLYSQMLDDGMVAEESARREYVGTLRRESERLARIVENVLEYARAGRGAAARGETLEVGELVLRVAPALRSSAERAGLGLEGLDGLGGLDATLAGKRVAVDPVSVERILVNLVDNACKYAPGTAARVAVHAVGRFVEIEVSDRGPGIPREQRGRLFEPFERGRSLAHAATPGLGLGLALSRALARRMGGELELRQSSGEGSVFVLRLPISAGTV